MAWLERIAGVAELATTPPKTYSTFEIVVISVVCVVAGIGAFLAWINDGKS